MNKISINKYFFFPLCFRSVSGVDVDPDLVHMEMQDTSGGTLTFQSAHVSVPFLFMSLVTPAQTQMDSLELKISVKFQEVFFFHRDMKWLLLSLAI